MDFAGSIAIIDGPRLRRRVPQAHIGEKHMRLLAILAAAATVLAAPAAFALDKVRFGTNWFAEAEHGGFYQAVVDGTYAKYGLDVTIVQGGPQANNGLLMIAGKIEFYMGGNMIPALSAVEQGIPTLAVAAMFQKDPQMIMSHPGQGLDTFADLTKSPIFIGKEGLATFYMWMESAYGFKEEMVKPYTYSVGPFLADPKSAQQGYVTSEPYAVEKTAHFKPNIFLLADLGFNTYATTIETRQELVDKQPDLVQRFVNASIIGWYHYLYGDNTKANEAIKKDNPDMTDDQIAYSIAKMKQYGLVDSGDTEKLGIGAMTDERMKSFYDKMVKAGVVPANIDYKKAYTLQFVDKGVGIDLRPK